FFFFFQAEDGIRDGHVTGVQTCALPISPKREPFKPDPFQLEALAALEFEDVLVTAPTGSGKTWIAREEIRRLLDAGKRAWYTTRSEERRVGKEGRYRRGG